MSEARIDTYVDGLGESHPLPRHWVSNEVWPTDVIAQLAASGIESAALVGSANLCSIAPFMPSLKKARFLDIVKGHEEIFISRVKAAAATREIVENAAAFEQTPLESIASSYIGGAFVLPFLEEQPGVRVSTAAGHTKAEGSLFDLDRPGGERMHFLASHSNLAHTADLASRIGVDLEVSGVCVDITKPSNAVVANASTSGERLGWVHVSNVAPVCLVGEVTRHYDTRTVGDIVGSLATSMVDFIGELDGVDDETLVTFANYGVNEYFGRNVPTVEVGRLGSMDPTLLITDADIKECLF